METFITQLLVECAQLASLVLPLRQARATQGNTKGERFFFSRWCPGIAILRLKGNVSRIKVRLKEGV